MLTKKGGKRGNIMNLQSEMRKEKQQERGYGEGSGKAHDKRDEQQVGKTTRGGQDNEDNEDKDDKEKGNENERK